MCASSSSRRAIYALSISALVSALFWRSEPAVVAQNASARATVTGCLVEEREYAGARGLASAAPGDQSTTQLVIIPDPPANAGAAASAGRVSAYALTGPRENGLATGSHHRVVLEGVIEGGLTGAPAPPSAADTALTPTGAVGVTADGGPAHEPTDAAGETRAGARTRLPDERPVSVNELDRINVTTARVLDDTCGLPRMPVTTAESRPADAVQSPTPGTPSTPATFASTITGCLVRRDADDSSASGVLTLLAYPRDERPFLTRGAVPGSFPSGSGSGTVGTAGVAAGNAEPIAYRVTGDESALAGYVGQRIEVTGVVDPTAGDTAHPSATRRAIRVTSFRAASGSCR